MIWMEFRNTYRGIIVSSNKSFCDEIKFKEWQDEYVTICGSLNDAVTSKNNKSNVSLERVKVPEFYGGATEWRMFKDLFDEYVHNNQSYSTATKMHYLKLSLRGDAAKLVGHISPNGNNYDTCYEMLLNRFENKREIVNKL